MEWHHPMDPVGEPLVKQREDFEVIQFQPVRSELRRVRMATNIAGATKFMNFGFESSSLKSNVERRRKKKNFKHLVEAVQSNGRLRRPQNVEGEFFVDHSCIDCDTCRWMAPQIFRRIDSKSAVFKQPTSDVERLEALQALLSCPTNSIRTEKPAPDVLQAQKTFPLPIDEQKIPGVFHCGYHSDKSYGAASYLIVHPEGNVIIDSPRYTEKLARNIEMLGGARYMFLTHKDDVADHEKWSKRLNLKRILHSGDVEARTSNMEIKLEGSGPWSLGNDMQFIHTPGHTEGSVCLFYESLNVLFTGDHLLMIESGLSICEMYNRQSVSMQLDSVRKLLPLDFKWILPGHGRRVEFKDYEEKNATLETFVDNYR